MTADHDEAERIHKIAAWTHDHEHGGCVGFSRAGNSARSLLRRFMKGADMNLVGKTCRVSRMKVKALGCLFSEKVKMNTRQLLRVIVTLGMLVTASQVALGEERTVQAMAPWQGSGEVFVVAPEKLMILVSFTLDPQVFSG
jgi:hypothetical protein